MQTRKSNLLAVAYSQPIPCSSRLFRQVALVTARQVVACTAANIQSDGTCLQPVWVDFPDPVLPPLDLADGSLVAFAIVSVWAVGLKARLVFKAGRTGGYA